MEYLRSSELQVVGLGFDSAILRLIPAHLLHARVLTHSLTAHPLTGPHTLQRVTRLSTIRPGMLRLIGLFLSAFYVLPALAVHDSEAGVVDWYKPLIGDALTGNPSLSPVFHRIGDHSGTTRSLVLTATTSNVLAALHPENGAIGAPTFTSP